MQSKRLQEFLDDRHAHYATIPHVRAVTAQEIAAAAHVPGRELAKTVMIKLDGNLAMLVVPSTLRVDFERVRRAIGVDSAVLAEEHEFKSVFPDCELGAMPPFGNLYGLDVYVDARLAEDAEIAFNDGSHVELVRMPYPEFAQLAGVREIRLD
jgi:Ala-tRNA(Pro) deacylase